MTYLEYASDQEWSRLLVVNVIMWLLLMIFTVAQFMTVTIFILTVHNSC